MFIKKQIPTVHFNKESVFIITFVHSLSTSTRVLRACECTVGVDVGDETATVLNSIPSNVVILGCIVLGGQLYVDFTMNVCKNTMKFAGMNVRFCTMEIFSHYNFDRILPRAFVTF